MVLSEDNSRKIRSFENLKNYILNNNLNEIDLNNEKDFYKNLIFNFYLGKLDDYYDNEVFDNMSYSTRINILNRIHKYQDLCFYKKDIRNWDKSIVDNDYNLITYLILDRFDFLIKLFIYAGEEALELLSKFSNSIYADKTISCVENIRRNFINDEIIFYIFHNICKDDSLFKVLTNNEIITLLEYPEGTLYFYGMNSIKIVDEHILILEIFYRMNGKSIDKFNFNNLKEYLKNFYLNDDGYLDTVIDMFYEYHLMNNKMHNIKRIAINASKEDLVKYWILTDKSLLKKDIENYN